MAFGWKELWQLKAFSETCGCCGIEAALRGGEMGGASSMH